MQKSILLVLDGWGLGDGSASDAVAQAKTPNMDKFWQENPHGTLITYGEAVGLPDGQMGNSEVGHLNLGAGRVVYQDLSRIEHAIKTGELAENPIWQEIIHKAISQNKAIHFIGLVSQGGVHSHQKHLLYLAEQAREKGVKNMYLHAFTDGRDTHPQIAGEELPVLAEKLAQFGVAFASVIGRYYAMDRDKRWERIKKSYDLLLHGQGKSAKNIKQAIAESYAEGIFDEFILPTTLPNFKAIQVDDIVLCFNFRTDRCREITQVLTQEDFPEFGMQKLPLQYYTLTEYDANFKHVGVILGKNCLKNTLGEHLSALGLSQSRLAETEKYPHVTFFFSGGSEEPFAGETRVLVPSPKVATYNLAPEMSALPLKDEVLARMQKGDDCLIVNFANPDMVGHTGVFDAIVKAVETVDFCLGEIIEEAKKLGYAMLVCADHGNADFAINADGSPNTAHTKNLVPVVVFDPSGQKKTLQKQGSLSDIAPTLLDLMHLDAPQDMGGKSLLIK
jgi:2,3-bisphosphoglycerate-independent phosphoglycerate mutase